MGEQDFFVSSANRQACEWLADDTGWPDSKLALVGPAWSGKTHLARSWADRVGGIVREARTLERSEDLPIGGARICVEDLDHLPEAAEEFLFHLHNHLLSTGGRLLLTGRTAPSRWPIALADLASRMEAASVVTIGEPDDALLRAVLTKHFADRQLTPDPRLIAWLLPRMERSFAEAARLVAELDRRALGETRVINQALARAILDTPPGGEE